MPPSSRDLERNADRLDRQAGHNVGHAVADLTSAVRDAWSAGVQRDVARQVRTAEDINGVLNNITDIYHQTERGVRDTVNNISTEFGRQMNVMGRENDDRLRPIANLAENVRRGTHDLQTAAEQRIADFRRTRPETADQEGVLISTIDGLITGGRPDGHAPREGTRPSSARQEVSQVGRPETPESRERAEERHRQIMEPSRRPEPHARQHRVEEGDSYWSIAAEQGGTRAQIAARMQRLQTLNHGRDLLPNISINMDS